MVVHYQRTVHVFLYLWPLHCRTALPSLRGGLRPRHQLKSPFLPLPTESEAGAAQYIGIGYK